MLMPNEKRCPGLKCGRSGVVALFISLDLIQDCRDVNVKVIKCSNLIHLTSSSVQLLIQTTHLFIILTVAKWQLLSLAKL